MILSISSMPKPRSEVVSYVSERRHLRGRSRCGLVVGGLHDRHDVVGLHGPLNVFDLTAHLSDHVPEGFGPFGGVLVVADALIREVGQRHL